MYGGDRVVETEKKNHPGRFRQYCEKHSFRPRSVILFALIIVLIVAGLAFFSLQKTANVSKTTSLGLKDIGELATQAGYFTTVQTISKARDILGVEVPGTRSNYVYSYDGTIKAGINFEEIRLDVDEEKHIIHVTFPEFRILSTEIDEDSFVLYNDGANLFTSLKLEEVNQSNAELKKNARETAVKNGLLENARANAEVLVKGFLASMYDLSIYSIDFRETPARQQ